MHSYRYFRYRAPIFIACKPQGAGRNPSRERALRLGVAIPASLWDDAMDTFSGLGDAILATASDAIIATNRNGAVTFWNAGAERIFGFDAADAIGQPLDLIIPDNLRDRHWQGYQRVMASGES